MMRVPRAARLLGALGVLPILFCLYLVFFEPSRDVQLIAGALMLLYGGIILSFIGGAWWGMATQRGINAQVYVLSVIPSLWAWPVVGWAWIEATFGWSAAFLSLGFVLVLPVDYLLVHRGYAPPWWMRLRAPLSCTMAAAFAALALKAL